MDGPDGEKDVLVPSGIDLAVRVGYTEAFGTGRKASSDRESTLYSEPLELDISKNSRKGVAYWCDKAQCDRCKHGAEQEDGLDDGHGKLGRIY